MNFFYSLVYTSLKPLFKIAYHHRIMGEENLPEGSAILACNHTSYIDPILVCISYPGEVFYLARSTLFRKPVLGWIIKHLNAISVNLNIQDSKMLKQVLELLKHDQKIVLFPEGKRSFDGNLSQLERGTAFIAMRSKSPIIPTYISGAYEAWPRKNWLPKLTGKTTCTFGKPIDPKNYEHMDKKQAINQMTDDLYQSLRNLSVITA